MEKKAVIKIVCDENVRKEFKKITVEFGTYEDAIKKFIQIYKANPHLFRE